MADHAGAYAVFLREKMPDMFDFYFGKPPQTHTDEVRYLIAVKRNLPRWCNSLPDAEFVAICDILNDLGREATAAKRPLTLVETGAGASTLALAYYAIKYNGIAYSWDMNAEKGSVIRTACTETMCTMFDSNINHHWKLVAYHTLSPHAGLGMIKELTARVDFIFHDSEHVAQTLLGELALSNTFLQEGSVVAIDDAYYDFAHTDTAFINIVRAKLGLSPIPELPGNRGQTLYQAAESFLKERWRTVESLADAYRASCAADVSAAYFSGELEVRSALGMSQVKNMEDRFGCWRVSGRR